MEDQITVLQKRLDEAEKRVKELDDEKLGLEIRHDLLMKKYIALMNRNSDLKAEIRKLKEGRG